MKKERSREREKLPKAKPPRKTKRKKELKRYGTHTDVAEGRRRLLNDLKDPMMMMKMMTFSHWVQISPRTSAVHEPGNRSDSTLTTWILDLDPTFEQQECDVFNQFKAWNPSEEVQSCWWADTRWLVHSEPIVSSEQLSLLHYGSGSVHYAQQRSSISSGSKSCRLPAGGLLRCLQATRSKQQDAASKQVRADDQERTQTAERRITQDASKDFLGPKTLI